MRCAEQLNDWPKDLRALTDRVTLIEGADKGRYPSGNSLLIMGKSETVIIDPSISVVERGGIDTRVDAVINSHAHEDHMAGNGLFQGAAVHIHEKDRARIADLDAMLDGYGLKGQARQQFRQDLQEQFYFSPCPDAHGFGDGHRFDLGAITVETLHLPGHTDGHCGFRIDGGVLFLSDIDLSGFGPYYGDVFSSLDEFEQSLAVVREEEADFYVTFHHKGVIETRKEFLRLLNAFSEVIERRHSEMLTYLVEPRTVDEMAQRRFVYRPHVQSPFADAVEKRTAELHLDRMISRGEAQEVEPGRFKCVHTFV